jgi:putative spermidine/putrescine transport system permease protein
MKALPPSATTGERIAYVGLRVFAALVCLFLVAPIAAIVPLSFSAGSFLHYPLPGLSLRWYADFFSSQFWLPSLWNSLFVGSISTVLAMVLGTVAAIGLWRTKFFGHRVALAIIAAPMIVPEIIMAVGMYFAFAPLGLTNAFSGIILAHTALAAPFVVITVLATLSGFDRSLIRAAANLGANPVVAFFRVMLPLILPGIVSGAVFAFAVSFDEVIAVLILGGPGQRTLPRQMFSGINDSISLSITAAATLLIVLSVSLMVCVELLRRRSERLAGRRG